MPRTSTKPVAPAEPREILPAVAKRTETAQELATVHKESVNALALKLNYSGSTDPAVLENSARDAIRRIGAGIFELGGYLLLMKEACEHGKFVPTLERLGIGVDAAQRYMAVTRRFANTASTRHLEMAGVTKLVELLPLDDEQLEDLTELGQTGELALDDVARMSVKELRSKVRELRADKDADDKVLSKKQARIDKLERDLHRLASAPVEKQIADELRELSDRAHIALSYVRGDLRLGFQKLFDREQDGVAEPGSHRQIMAGYVREIEHELAVLKSEFFLLEPPAANAAGN